jgi:glycosyltransferase involved in cell wall biosynthesis
MGNPIAAQRYIMDTGSTDDTVAIIERVTAEYPHVTGKLEHQPFVDFA